MCSFCFCCWRLQEDVGLFDSTLACCFVVPRVLGIYAMADLQRCLTAMEAFTLGTGSIVATA
jgi:hypothetical protein